MPCIGPLVVGDGKVGDNETEGGNIPSVDIRRKEKDRHMDGQGRQVCMQKKVLASCHCCEMVLFMSMRTRADASFTDWPWLLLV